MKWSYRFTKHSFAWNSLHFLTCFWPFLSIIPSFICLTKLGIEIKTFFFRSYILKIHGNLFFYIFFAVVAFSNFAISANKYGTNDDDGLICGNFLFLFFFLQRKCCIRIVWLKWSSKMVVGVAFKSRWTPLANQEICKQLKYST